MNNLPIGYWLKKADQLLTQCIDDAQHTNHLARTEWQVLNALYDAGTSTESDIAQVMQPFIDIDGLRHILHDLADRNLVETISPDGPKLRLTEHGTSLHAKAMSMQKSIREKAMDGISQDDYTTTVRVLQRIAANLSS